MREENEHLHLCKQQIEQLLNWGNSSEWGSEEYEELRIKIFEKTQVQLSVSTLKRIWGKVRYQSFPSLVTLNAMARFANYNSWRDFKRYHDLNSFSAIPDSTGEKNKKSDSIIYSYKRIWIVAGILIFGVFLFWILKHEKTRNNTRAATFTSRVISDDLPNSVVFNFHTSVQDSVYIQQSWDPARREKVSGSDSIHTSIYYHPGYFLAKLIVNGFIKKETTVFIKTKGWKGIIDKNPVPVYLSDQEIKNTGYMGINSTLLQRKTGTEVFNGVWVKFSNVKEYNGIDAGNFTLNTVLKNTSTLEQSVCRSTKVVILGIGKAIVIPLTSKGCTADIRLFTGDKLIDGKTTDMSAFGCDFNKFQHLSCQINQKKLMIYLNNKQIFSNSHENNLGRIVGIRIEFEGAGEVKSVKLETPGQTPYEEHF